MILLKFSLFFYCEVVLSVYALMKIFECDGMVVSKSLDYPFLSFLLLPSCISRISFRCPLSSSC